MPVTPARAPASTLKFLGFAGGYSLNRHVRTMVGPNASTAPAILNVVFVLVQ